MAAVVSELQGRTADTNAIVQYFFCNAGDDATKRTERILKHLLSQIYELVSQEPTEILEKSNKLISTYLKGTKSTKSGQADKKDDVTFGDAFRGIVALLGKPAYIMVDALDECSDRPKGLLSSLRELVEEPLPTIKVILCSRPDPDIQTGLDKVSTIKVEGNNGPDIKLNAETELAKLPGWTANERDLATQKIVEKAGSYFRYVDLAISFLKQPWQRPLKKHLEQLPEGLPAFYEQIIKKTDPAYLDLLKTCLTWTILAEGKVRVAEIIDAYSRVYAIEDEYAQEPPKDELDDETEEPDQTTPDADELYISQIRTAGSSLLEVDAELKVIQLRHNTVADHFLNAAPLDSAIEEVDAHVARCQTCAKVASPAYRFSVSEKKGHLSIATIIRKSIHIDVYRCLSDVPIVKHLMNESFRQKYLIPFERTKLRGMWENSPHGFQAGEENQDAKPSEQNAIETEISSEAKIVDEEGVVSPKTEAETPKDQDDTQEHPNVAEEIEPESITAQGNDESAAEEVDPAKAQSDADTDVVSDVDSDLAFDEAEQPYFVAEDDNAQSYRYEVMYCAYHLRRVEELFGPEDRVGPEWTEFENLRIAFFQNDSPYFRSWVNLVNQIRGGILSWVDDTESIQPTHAAAAYGLTSLMYKLITDGADLTLLTDEGYTALDYAVEYYGGVKKDEKYWYENSLNLFKVLLEGGADVNAIPVRARVAPFYRLFW